ncbi:MAG TPA: ATPase, T2SS/T4P/T4SS family, partial [Methylomirabilota bacterium]|nr:ATPase, T2SS/T4P/T4SS family [Methylomirabilota bacterium]
MDTLEIQPNSLRLGQILTRERVITPDVLREAMARALRERLRLGETLVVMGAATTSDILRALATQQGMAFLAADELPSTPPALKELSPKYLRQYVACPIAVEAGTVTVATADPTNPQLLDDLQQLLGLTVKLCVAPAPAILEAIERAYGANTALQKIVEGMGGSATAHHAEPEEDVNHLRDMAFEAPVVRLVNLLIDGALAADASDIHIEPFEDSLRVRYRIDGLLYDQEAPPRRLQAALTSRIKIMAELNIAERRLPQDGRIRVTGQGGR